MSGCEYFWQPDNPLGTIQFEIFTLNKIKVMPSLNMQVLCDPPAMGYKF